MHALHSLAHRAPPATRTRVRWQPYTTIPSSSCSSSSSRSSPPSSYLNTPTSSVTSSPQITTPTTDIDRIRQILPSATFHPKEPPSRDTHRNKYAISLVDQAVKSLCEIWRPQDIPTVFVASARAMVSGGASYEPTPLINQKPDSRDRSRNTQLPSPVSPSTRSSPSLTALSSPPSSIPETPPPSDQDIASLLGPRGNLVPIKAFVHEVLRRSRTSGCVLQTALCYLEAIRSKVPDLVREEQSGEGVKGEPDLSDRITPATEAELERETVFTLTLNSILKAEKVADEDVMATVRVHDHDSADSSPVDEIPMSQSNQRLLPGPTLPALPPLPSPLLCPRRAFLASLILASKFTQDKCYSNRAWAKLSGLPPREIGRCERALGEALEWRLWVGKQPSASQTPAISPLAPMNRPVVRSQSESSLFIATSTQTSFLVREEKSDESPSISRTSNNRGLRRCSTLPAEVCSAPVPTIAIPVDPPWRVLANLSSVDSHDIQDNDMHSPDQVTQTEPLSVQAMDLCPSTSAYPRYSEKLSQSPSPQTPGLSYSPSSTESCSGDRTIQMSSFLDDSMGTFNSNHLGINSSDSWPWSDSSEMVPCLSKTPSPPFHHSGSASHKNNPVLEHFGSLPSVAGCGGSLPIQLSSGMGANAGGCPWVADDGIQMYSLQS